MRDASLAVRLAKKAVNARPQSGDYRNTLGVAHYRNGDDKAAVTELETAISLRGGGDSFDWLFLAMAYGAWGRATRHGRGSTGPCEMDTQKPQDGELRRFRAEAEAMLDDPNKR